MTTTNQEQELLREFVHHAKRLEDHSLVQQQAVRVSARFTYRGGLPSSIEQFRVNVELLEVILTRLRVFYVDSEKITLKRILNILGREFRDDFTVENFRELRKLLRHSPFEFIIDGRKMASQDIWDDYLYAEIFHADMERKKRLRDLHRIEPMIYMGFVNTTVNRSDAVLWTANYILHRVPGVL